MIEEGPILVTGATGAQGGAVVDALLERGRKVRALCRPTSDVASLKDRGVEIAMGDFDDADALADATRGAIGVFSVQLPPAPGDDHGEERAGRNLIEAARQNGVEQFVHTSVARAGDEQHFQGWEEGRWWREYWTNKTAVNEALKSAGFGHWTILKPAFMMENFIPPKASFMFPALAGGVLETAMTPETKLDLITASDIGRFAAAAFADPETFDGLEIDLAGDSLTMEEVALMISNVTGKPVQAHYLSYDDAVAAGIYPGVAENQQWLIVEGYRVDLQKSASFGIPLENFSSWSLRHADSFV